MSRLDALIEKLERRHQSAAGYDHFADPGSGSGGFGVPSFGGGDAYAYGISPDFGVGVAPTPGAGFGAADTFPFGQDFPQFGQPIEGINPAGGASPSSAQVPSFEISEPSRRSQLPSSPVMRFEDFLTPHASEAGDSNMHRYGDGHLPRLVAPSVPPVQSEPRVFPSEPSANRYLTLPQVHPDSAQPRVKEESPVHPWLDQTLPAAAFPHKPKSDAEKFSNFRAQPEPKPHPARAETVLSDEFGDIDDSWLVSAAHEAIKVEESLPPRLSYSPHFPQSGQRARATHNAPLRPPSHLKPPSRPASTSDVKFPKPATAKVSIAPESKTTTTPQPQHFPTPAIATKVSTPQPPPPTIRQPVNNRNVLVPVKSLEWPAAENIFYEFTHFNPMQSEVFDAAYNGSDNLVVTAPTGSGKTTVFELAFLRMYNEEKRKVDKEKRMSDEEKRMYNEEQRRLEDLRPLAIYIAPTKALVNERFRDWSARMQGLDKNFKCLELTGDSNTKGDSRHVENVLKEASLIVTTPEKWDSVTRRTKFTLSRLELVMIDEIHILREDRGPTLEAIVSRMKRMTMARFVAVSASVPNMEDVARWIGKINLLNKPPQIKNNSTVPEVPEVPEVIDLKDMPMATVFKFGDDFRSVPLTKRVIGFEAFNDFVLGPKLDKQLFAVLNAYSNGKPVLIFSPTRKACGSTATQLVNDYQAAIKSRTKVPWVTDSSNNAILKDPKVQEFTKYGIAVHHAGLDYSDRRNIEDSFKSGKLHCLIATSTLAVGINLPAYLVVIKGTSMWQGQGFRDYSDVDIQQMMGRAGRPQFSHEGGRVVIMCNERKKDHFENILASRMVLESCLHEHLTEHINNEILLKTITDLESGKEWLNGTFLAIRLRQNPRHYVSTLVRDHSKTWEETLDRYMETTIELLKKYEFVGSERLYDPYNPDDRSPIPDLNPTAIGKIMSQNFISYATMRQIAAMKEDASVADLLQILAAAAEFSGLRIRQGEGGTLNALRLNPEIRFGLDEGVKTYADKVFLHMQVAFGNVNIDSSNTKTEHSSPIQTQMTIFQIAPRIAKAILLVAIEKKYGIAIRSALELLHTVNGKAWEDSATIFRQVHQIGPKSITILGNNDMTSFDAFQQLSSSKIELWLNRLHPFGQSVLDWVSTFPRFKVEFQNAIVLPTDGECYPTLQVDVTLSWTGCLKRIDGKKHFGKLAHHAPASRAKLGFEPYNLTIVLISSKNRLLDLRKISTGRLLTGGKSRTTMDFEIILEDPEETIQAIIGVDELAGVSNTFEFKPEIDPSLFPVKPPAVSDKAAKLDEIVDAEELGDGPSSAVKRVTKSKRRAAEPLFVPKDDLLDSDYEEEELIDLTVKASHNPKEKRPVGDKPASSRPKNSKQMKASMFVDDEAVESDGGDNADNSEEGDDVRSVGSFGELDQFFDDSTPPPSKPKGDQKGKRKAEFGFTEVKRHQRQNECKLSTPPIDFSSLDDSVPLPSPPPSTVRPSASKANLPSATKSVKRARYALTPPTSARGAADSGVQFNPTTGKLRNTFYKRTPSVEKEARIDMSKPSRLFSDLDSTLAPAPNSLGSMPSTSFQSPIPEFVDFSVDVPIREAAGPSPPSDQPDDFDEWVNGLLNQ